MNGIEPGGRVGGSRRCGRLRWLLWLPLTGCTAWPGESAVWVESGFEVLNFLNWDNSCSLPKDVFHAVYAPEEPRQYRIDVIPTLTTDDELERAERLKTLQLGQAVYLDEVFADAAALADDFWEVCEGRGQYPASMEKNSIVCAFPIQLMHGELDLRNAFSESHSSYCQEAGASQIDWGGQTSVGLVVNPDEIRFNHTLGLGCSTDRVHYESCGIWYTSVLKRQ